jgi:U6 snRNA-associated Sm-like protein LSm3
VEETVYVLDEEDEEENVRTVKKQSEMLFVRGISRMRYNEEVIRTD